MRRFFVFPQGETMTTTQTKTDLNLRQRAEERAKKELFSSQEPISHEEMQRMLHELLVHQIELQMQNEELHLTLVELAENKIHLEKVLDEYEASLRLLKESEAHFRLLTENVSDVVWKMDSNFHVTYISPADERLRGYKAEEVVGGHVFDQMTEESIAVISEKTRQRIEAEQRGIQTNQLSFEVQQRCKDDSLVWTEILSTAERNAEGEIIGYHGISRNINERKRIEEAVKLSELFLQSTLDGLSAHIALLDDNGVILLVNKAWRDFAYQNGLSPEVVSEGTNYLQICNMSSGGYAEEAEPFAEGIKMVLTGEKDFFYMEYPCHTPHEKRWFAGRITPFQGEGARRVVIAHENITERKLAQEMLEESHRQLEAISITDGLTGIANRRHFDEVLVEENARHARSGAKLSLIMLDIDFFKAYNDSYGHVEGDKCIQRIAQVIADCANRPADLVARYGGEEFVCILPETDSIGAVVIAEKIRKGISALKIPHIGSINADHVTASLGVVTTHCDADKSVSEIIVMADNLLYGAKNSGRNNVQFSDLSNAVLASSKCIGGNLVQLTWKESFCSGNHLIDQQHESLLLTSNELLEAILRSQPHEEKASLLARLLNEVSQHFHDEEFILKTIAFPGIVEHRAEHSKLLEKGLELSGRFNNCDLLLGDVFQFIALDVVMGHIIGTDMEYFSFTVDCPDATTAITDVKLEKASGTILIAESSALSTAIPKSGELSPELST